MFNPPISSGANLFIFIALAAIAFVAAVIAVDVYRETLQKKENNEKE